MNCETYRKSLFEEALGEGSAELREHIKACPECRAELERLKLTRKLMVQGLPEEEPPRRIAFVAEKPQRNPLRFWQWSFAGAAAFAVFFAALALRPQPAGTFTRAEVEQIVNARVQESEQRQRAELRGLLQNASQRMAEQLYTLEQTQSLTYKAAEQSRAEVQQVAALLGRNRGGTQQ
jgi:anti-sigma factor RsiW